MKRGEPEGSTRFPNRKTWTICEARSHDCSATNVVV